MKQQHDASTFGNHENDILMQKGICYISEKCIRNQNMNKTDIHECPIGLDILKFSWWWVSSVSYRRYRFVVGMAGIECLSKLLPVSSNIWKDLLKTNLNPKNSYDTWKLSSDSDLQEHKESSGRPLWLIRIFLPLKILGCLLLLSLVILGCNLLLFLQVPKSRIITWVASFKPKLRGMALIPHKFMHFCTLFMHICARVCCVLKILNSAS